ncbi:hypothetical protein KCV07_g5261, partial [Aureobasidium melanogenum]
MVSILLQGARESLAKARQDEFAIRRDYEVQFEEFEDYHGRGPSHEELVQTHFAHHSANAAEYLDKFAESHQHYLDTEPPQDPVDDDEDAEMLEEMQEKGKMKAEEQEMEEEEEEDEEVDLSILDCTPKPNERLQALYERMRVYKKEREESTN